MSTDLATRYPRTLFEWLKSDDKLLVKAIAAGQSVLEVAEDLQREHTAVLRRLDELQIYAFLGNTEEWVEVMGLGLAGVPLQVVIDWCSAAPERLDLAEIESLAMGDLRPEFSLAMELGIMVGNSDAVGDLSWLQAQPQSVQAGYPAACQIIIDRFDVVTPETLKNQVLGFTPALPQRQWMGTLPAAKGRKASYSKPRAKTYRRKSSRSYAGFKKKSYARRTSAA